ncbi:MAG: hypothetical protein QXV57_06825 [Thermoproteota archaeon]
MEDLETVEKYLESIDPFDIPLEKYRSLINDKSRSKLLHVIARRIYELHGEWIKEELKRRKAESLLVCDKKVIAASKNRYGFTLRQITQAEDELGKPCYLLSGEALIEENAEWSRLGDEDYYPAIEVYLGKEEWSDESVFNKGVKVRSDFDTGNPEYAVFNEAYCRRILEEADGIGYGQHLGRGYSYYFRSMKIGIRDGEKGRCLTKIVEGVDNWSDIRLNPYIIANPNREGFVGRDLMLKLFFKITLDPALKRSSWKLL